MAIRWSSRYEIGSAMIDADHRYLFALVNAVELHMRLAVAEGYDTPQTNDLLEQLDELEQYAKDHFTREERLMQMLGYTDYLEHKVKHAELAAQFTDLYDRIRDAAHQRVLAEQVGELAQLLRSWIVRHVMTEDMKLRTLIQDHPVSARSFAIPDGAV